MIPRTSRAHLLDDGRFRFFQPVLVRPLRQLLIGEALEVDGDYFGDYIKPANHKKNRRDRRLAKNQNGKHKVVVVAWERGGRTLPSMFKTEVDSIGFIINRVNPASKLVADEAVSWNALHAKFDVSRIAHSNGFGTYSNRAESFFSHSRWAEIGYHDHIAKLS